MELILFPFVSELFKFPLSSSDSAFSAPLWFFYHSGITGFDITSRCERSPLWFLRNLHPSSPRTEIFDGRTNLRVTGSMQNNDNFQKSGRYLVGCSREILSFSTGRGTESNFESCIEELGTLRHGTNHFLD